MRYISEPKLCYCPFKCTSKLEDFAFEMREEGIPWDGPNSQPFECMGDPLSWRDSTFDAAPFNDSFTEDRFNSAKLEKHVAITKKKIQNYASLRQEMFVSLKEAKEAFSRTETLASRLL